MEIRLPFERLLAYDRWANGEALASLEAMAEPPAKARELMGHLMGAEVGWIQRMTEGTDPGDWETWENAGPEWLRTAWREVVAARWSAFLADASLSDPARGFNYVNHLDQALKARVQDVVIQLMLHSAYHRGQVASAVRAAGGKPAVTDYLHAVRSGAVA